MPAVSVNLPIELIAKIEEISKKENKSRSEIVTELLRKALGD